MKNLNEIILEILNEIEENDNILNLSGIKGYGTGSARVKDPHSVSKNLGPEKKEKQEEYVSKPVEISKAFKKENK